MDISNKLNQILTILVVIVISSSCQKEKLYTELSQLSGTGIIKIDNNNISGNIGKIFSKYIYTTAPNGKRIEIFGTSGVSDDQMEYAREILVQYLTIDGDVYSGEVKKAIANSMANKKTALAFFDTQEQYEANISKLLFTGYNIQDLYASESWGSGNRDASYEEILHMVHNYGIAPVLLEFQERIQKANDEAIANGLWKPWSNLPKSDYDDEYLGGLMDTYVGLWEGTGTSYGQGSYKPTTKDEMKTLDPKGYKIIRDLFGDIKTVR